MESLKSSDLRKAIAFLNEYCVATETDDYTQRVLEGLHHLIDSDQWALGEFSPSDGAVSAVVTVEPKDFWLPSMESFVLLGGVQAHLNWYGSRDTAMRLSDVMTRRELHQHKLYPDFYKLIGAEDALFTLFDAGCAMFLGSTLGTTVSNENKELFDLLVRPVAHNLKNVRALARLEQSRELITDALETAYPSVVVADLKGKIQAEARTARELLLTYFKAEAFGDSLPKRLMQFAATQRARLTQLGKEGSSSQELRLERDSHHLIVAVAIQSSGYIFSLHEESTSPRIDYLQRLGLSKREAEVLDYVAMGKTNPEIAIILDISRLTVGKHMERILLRLGVETRTAAAAAAIEARRTVAS
jgi:DNA-binding CsgD family transcriptional regulator